MRHGLHLSVQTFDAQPTRPQLFSLVKQGILSGSSLFLPSENTLPGISPFLFRLIIMSMQRLLGELVPICLR